MLFNINLTDGMVFYEQLSWYLVGKSFVVINDCTRCRCNFKYCCVVQCNRLYHDTAWSDRHQFVAASPTR